MASRAVESSPGGTRVGSELISVLEAAEALGCSPVWVLKLLKTGKLTGRMLTPRSWMVTRKSVADNLEEHRTRSPRRAGRPRSNPPGISAVPKFDRIAHDPKIFAGEAIVKGTRIRVAALAALAARGVTEQELLDLHADLTAEDVRQAVRYSRA
jgi:uncharacterized protein (DUF433 family)